MKKFILSAIAATACVVASAVPVAGPVSVDFRGAAWNGANGQTTFSTGGVTATASYLNAWGNPQNAKLRQSNSNGLGVDSDVLFEDPNELGPREILDIDFSGVTGIDITGVWLTKIFDEILDDAGFVNLFGAGNSFLGTVSFSGNNNDNDGNLWVDFGGAVDLTSAVFYGQGTVLGARDYSVAGFTAKVVENPHSVPDNGLTAMLLGVALLGLGAARRATRNA